MNLARESPLTRPQNPTYRLGKLKNVCICFIPGYFYRSSEHKGNRSSSHLWHLLQRAVVFLLSLSTQQTKKWFSVGFSLLFSHQMTL